jgi:type I restriction enzyme S subunit
MAKPEIRLKGFEGEWKRHTLEECLSISNERNTNKLFGRDDVLSVSDDFGVVNQIKLLGRSYAGADLSGYKVVRPGQVIYTKSPLRLKPFGIIKENHQENGIVSVLYAVYNTSEKLLSSFVDLFFAPSYRTNNYLLPLISKGAKNTINISDENALKGTIYIPIVDEQIGITDYFNSLDSMIQSTTKKIESLKKMKSASLASMFPQASETTPRVRFKGFEGEWVKDKAVNLFMTFNERNRPDLPVLSANQDIRGMAPRSDTGYTISHNKANEVTYKVVKPGQYVIHLRSFQGGFAHSAVEGITSPAYTVFGFKNLNLHDDYFWKIIFMSKSFIKSLETITYGIRDGRSISFSEFSEMSFLFPSKQEQQKISTYFRSLDKQISLQEQKLEKLKQIKAACLDKMFV